MVKAPGHGGLRQLGALEDYEGLAELIDRRELSSDLTGGSTIDLLDEGDVLPELLMFRFLRRGALGCHTPLGRTRRRGCPLERAPRRPSMTCVDIETLEVEV